MIVVAIIACLSALQAQDWHSITPEFVALTAGLAGLFGLGAMRRPWFFLTLAIAINVTSPKVFDSPAHSLFDSSYTLGWIIGAPVGWITRLVRTPAASREIKADPPEPW